jgi:hypothetical protein
MSKTAELDYDDPSTNPKNGVWWDKECRGERHPHDILQGVVSQITSDQGEMYEGYRRYQKEFGVAGLGGANGVDFLLSFNDGVRQNEMANTIETLWAQVFKNRVVPGVSCSDAEYDEWYRAKGLSRWLEGAFDDAEVYKSAIPQAGLAALVYGTGCVKVTIGETEDAKVDKVCAESVSPRHVFTDRIESKNGKPRSLFQKDYMDRWVAYAVFGPEGYGTAAERKHGIAKVKAASDEDLTTGSSKHDMITVWEAWHLPSTPRAKDGRHVIWVEGCTLVDEPWTWPTFPFAFIRFGARMEGFWGESAVKRLLPTQKLLDKLNAKIDECQDVMGVPRIITRPDNFVKDELDDTPGGVILCKDINAIKDWNAQCAAPEMYNDRDGAPGKMRSLLGVSDFEVQSQIPQGMRDVSGAFLERWVDQGQARHAMFHKEYEEAIVDLAKLFVRAADDIQKSDRDVVVITPENGRDSVESLKFSDVKLDIRRLKITVQPMSGLPQTLAGKVEAITKMAGDAKLPLDPKRAMRFLNVPDVFGATDTLVSSEEIIAKNLSFMVRTGKYLDPLQHDNLDLIIQMTTEFINTFRVREGADLTKVGLLQRYIRDAIVLRDGFGKVDPNAPPPPPIDPMAGPPGDVGGGMLPPMDPNAPPMGPGGMPPLPPEAMPPMPGMPEQAGPPGGLPPPPMM